MRSHPHQNGSLALLAMLCSYGATAAAPDTVQAMWKPQKIEFSYYGFTTAYECRALEAKIERILKTLGAHENTQASASGCEFDYVSRSAFVRLTTASPVEANQEYKDELAKDKSRQDLIKRLGGKNQMNMDEFPAAWKRIELSRDRRLDLQPGDCELMEVLKEKVFPMMSIEVEQDEIRCTPNHLSMSTPALTVSALVKTASPDAPSEQNVR